MRITRIKTLKSSRFGLFDGEQFLLSLDEATLADSGLAVGDELTEEELEGLKARAEDSRAKDRALTLLAMRDHSAKELRDKLGRKLEAESADRAVARMEQLGLIDDGRFAASYAAELVTRRRYGRRRAVYELIRKGIGREAAEEAVDALDADPAEGARALLRQKFPRGLVDEADRRRAVSALQRRGYDWEDIRRALDTYGMDEENAD